MALVGALGAVAGAIALAYLPRAPRIRSSDSARAYVRGHARVGAQAIRDARNRVEPTHPVRIPAEHERRRPQLRVVASAFKRRARPRRAHLPHEPAVGPVGPAVAAREVVPETVAQPTHAPRNPQPVEFSFER
jgi:hypothetical protein